MRKQNSHKETLGLLRQKAEELLKNKAARTPLQLLDADDLKLLHKLEVRQIELELQNEELMLSQSAGKLADEKYAELYDSAPTGYFTLSTLGEITELNLSGAAMLGKPRHQLKNSKLGFFITIETRPIFNQFLTNLFLNHNKETCEVILLAEGHHPMPVLMTGISDISMEQFRLSVVDITERKQSEKALLAGEQKYRLMLESSEIGVGVYSLEGKILYYNQRALHNLGGKADDYIGKTLHEIFGEAAASVFVSRIQEAAQSEKSIEYEEFVKLAPGNRWFLSIYSRLTSPDGKVFGVQVIFHDITERKQAEEKLQASTEFAKNLIAFMTDGVSVVDTNGIHINVNPAFCLMTGFSREELLGTGPPHLYWPPEEYGPIEVAFQEALVSDSTNFELIFMRKNGERFPVIVSPFAIKDKLGNTVSYSATIKDISERKKVENALRESEQKFRNTIASLDEGYYSVSVDGLLLDYNQAFCHILGFDRKENLKGYQLLKIWQKPDDRQEYIRELMAKDSVSNYLIHAKKKSGEKIIAMASAHLIKDKSGNPVRIEGIFLDITNRIHAEESLRETNAYLENLINYANAPIIVWDPQFNITRFNHAFESLTGWLESEVLGKSIEILFPPASVEKSMTLISNTLTGVRMETVEIEILRSDGSIGTIIWNSATLFETDGKTPKATIAQGQDITERKLAEESLLKSEEQFRYLFENSIDSVAVHQIILDEGNNPIDYIFLSANVAFEKQTGLKVSDIVGKRVTEVIPGVEKTTLIAIYGKVALAGESISFEQYFKPLDRHYHINAYQVGYGRFVTVFQDITESKRVEEEIKSKNEELQKLNIEKDKFFSIIAHDLRSPFSAFLGYTQMMEEELETFTLEELQNIASTMRKSANMLFNLLENLLEWSRMQRGLNSFKPELFLLREQIEAGIELVRDATEKKKIRIREDIPADLHVFADPQMFKSLMRNLVFNAIKFTLQGGEIKIGAKTIPGNSVQVWVKDTGIGMKKDILDKLFRMNEDTSRKGTDGESSTGLGLIICKDFIDKLGGEIWAESEEGKGSTFYFTLPGSNEPEYRNINGIPVPTHRTFNDIKPLKILIAEDDDTSEMLISITLKKFSKVFLKAATGSDAVKICRANPDIDLIMMDIQMPEMDGYEATRRIRQFNPNVVIIAQTAFGKHNESETAKEAGCNEYITKPLSLDTLRKLMLKHF
jgi:PAS domain S-box-containing protein